MGYEPDKALFSCGDLGALIRLACDLTLRGSGRSSRIIQLVTVMKALLRAECACVFESRGDGAGSMLEIYRDKWRDWHTDALSNELTGRPIGEIAERPIELRWLPPRSSNLIRPHYALASCLQAGLHYFVTLAFVRRAQPFTARESALLQIIHRSELIALIAPTRAPSVPPLSRRLKQVLGRLIEGDAEKQIATRLTLSRHTVHQYVKHLYKHYRVNSRGELLSLSVDPIARQRLKL